MPVLVVDGALLRVREHLVGLLGLLEMLLRLLVVRIAVRVKLHRQAAIGLLDLSFGGGPRYVEYLVVVALRHAGLTRPCDPCPSPLRTPHPPRCAARTGPGARCTRRRACARPGAAVRLRGTLRDPRGGLRQRLGLLLDLAPSSPFRAVRRSETALSTRARSAPSTLSPRPCRVFSTVRSAPSACCARPRSRCACHPCHRALQRRAQIGQRATRLLARSSPSTLSPRSFSAFSTLVHQRHRPCCAPRPARGTACPPRHAPRHRAPCA